jgi:ATP-dependent exoDNAse (exonuclease V) beta subunit
VDRAFRAGIIPLSEGDDAWWIIDYKTTHADDIEAELALPQLRPLFSPQLELYAQVLRMMHGNEIRVLAGLYYPRMLAFDSWEL